MPPGLPSTPGARRVPLLRPTAWPPCRRYRLPSRCATPARPCSPPPSRPKAAARGVAPPPWPEPRLPPGCRPRSAYCAAWPQPQPRTLCGAPYRGARRHPSRRRVYPPFEIVKPGAQLAQLFMPEVGQELAQAPRRWPVAGRRRAWSPTTPRAQQPSRVPSPSSATRRAGSRAVSLNGRLLRSRPAAGRPDGHPLSLLSVPLNLNRCATFPAAALCRAARARRARRIRKNNTEDPVYKGLDIRSV